MNAQANWRINFRANQTEAREREESFWILESSGRWPESEPKGGRKLARSYPRRNRFTQSTSSADRETHGKWWRESARGTGENGLWKGREMAEELSKTKEVWRRSHEGVTEELKGNDRGTGE